MHHGRRLRLILAFIGFSLPCAATPTFVMRLQLGRAFFSRPTILLLDRAQRAICQVKGRSRNRISHLTKRRCSTTANYGLELNDARAQPVVRAGCLEDQRLHCCNRRFVRAAERLRFARRRAVSRLQRLVRPQL